MLSDDELKDRYCELDYKSLNTVKLAYRLGYEHGENEKLLPLIRTINDNVEKEIRKKIVSKLNDYDYCDYCIHFDKDECEWWEYKEHGHCDTDAMERAIVRMIEAME